jgi:UDP-N-acetylglucosamine acyltransferase
VIDDRSLVDPGATIGKDVSIGPFTIVESDVVIGSGTSIGPNVVIRSNTTIGVDNKIYQFSSVGEDPQYAGYQNEKTYLEIGDRNVVREYCTLNRGSPVGSGTTRIGNDSLIMAYAHIAHDSILGDHVVFANGASLAGHVEIGDYAILGGFTLVHQHCRIGAYSMTGIGSVCLQDVPPFVLAAGNTASPCGLNIRGLRRHGFSESVIQALRGAYRSLYRQELNLDQALAQLDRIAGSVEEIAALVDFVRGSRRGIIR